MKTASLPASRLPWPELDYERWKDTRDTLHRWTQVIGKIRLSKTPWINHSWHATLYLTECGLTTSVIHDRSCSFSIELDLIHHLLQIRRSDGKIAAFPLVAESVAAFHDKCFKALADLGIEAKISEQPNELPDATLLSKDNAHASYDPAYATRFWQALLQADRVMKIFRTRFVGKASPVHFFWGSFDLAVTRFSGRRAPEHPGGVPHLPDLVTREAYSHEVSSCGFWPGNDAYPHAAFYSYAYPKPEGFELARISPEIAFFNEKLREFVLPYDAVRATAAPEELLMSFFQSTYEAAANLGRWNRRELEETPYLNILRKKSA